MKYSEQLKTFWRLYPVNGSANKIFIVDDDYNIIESKNYSAGYWYRPESFRINNFFDWIDELKKQTNSFIVWGWPTGEKRKIIRRIKNPRPDEVGGNTLLTNREINIFPVDIDGFNGTVEDFIGQLPGYFHNVSFVCSYSSSYLIKSGLRAHLLFELSEGIDLETQRHISKNINKEIGENFLDPAIYQPQQPFFCSPPFFLSLNGNIKPDVVNERVWGKPGIRLNSQKLVDEYGYCSEPLGVYIPGDTSISALSSIDALKNIGVLGHHEYDLAYARALAREGKAETEIIELLRSALENCNRLGKTESEFRQTYLSENYLRNEARDAINFVNRNR